MKVVLTGWKGMVGSKLLPKLKEKKFETICPDFDLVNEDAYKSLKINGEYIVVHLAGEKGNNINGLIRNNIIATSHLINQLCLNNLCKGLVFVSSIAVFGIHDYIITEESPLLPDTFYGYSKKICEDIIKETLKNKSYMILRPTNIFSEDTSTLVGYIIDKAIRGEAFDAWSESLDTIRDYIFIDDVVEAIVKSIEKLILAEVRENVNLVGENLFTLNEVIAFIESAIKRKVLINIKTANNFRPKNLKIEPSAKFRELIKRRALKLRYGIDKIIDSKGV